ncbi:MULTISPECIES: VOC family protein [unclassified Pseudovibrio]|uniref:VOC family protein n=1 Tax=unclassified Pseudovibrio TaxID=2627060 RepID=UPI0007AED613|nr:MULTISPECIES: VOC family protein [unclassified Pseudovibrio]KZL17542.1 Glyoxalase-like domain protein [Pseudovibrio sp. Ad37]KZL19432.1 Glyoxalase-like domain protein [Pseudovibrio sp. WM33]
MIECNNIANVTSEFGIILFVEDFKACENFYEHILGLEIIEREGNLTTFRMGQNYLMVERGGHGSSHLKNRGQNPFVLRFNMNDIDASIETLRANNVQVKRQVFDWGTIAGFCDPDGNLCELKSPASVGG